VLRLTDRGPAFGSFQEAAWFAAIDDDLATVRAVLEDQLRHHRQRPPTADDETSSAGVVIATRLLDYWYYRSQTADCAAWLDMVMQALESGAAAEPVDEALALACTASVRSVQGRADLAAPLVDRMLPLIADVPPARRLEVGHALGRLATAVWSTDDLQLMTRVHAGMTVIADAVGDESLTVFTDTIACLLALPISDPDDGYQRAAATYARAMAVDHAFAAWNAAGACSIVALQQGRPTDGMLWIHRVIDIHWKLGTRSGGWYLETDANLTCLAGDFALAAAGLHHRSPTPSRTGTRPRPLRASLAARRTMVARRCPRIRRQLPPSFQRSPP
jgi:hypothetical protein